MLRLLLALYLFVLLLEVATMASAYEIIVQLLLEQEKFLFFHDLLRILRVGVKIKILALSANLKWFSPCICSHSSDCRSLELGGSVGE